MAVPMRNIYYLLCYAWRSNLGDYLRAGEIPGDRPEDLFALLLAQALEPLLPHRLDRGFIEEQEDLRGPRGKILLGATTSRALRPRGRAACSFDEISVDIPSNRVLKCTLRRLRAVPSLAPELRARVDRCVRALSRVANVGVSAADAARVVLHGNNAPYLLLMRICRLVLEQLLPVEGAGTSRMRSFFGDESAMGRLFQEFLYQFLRREQRGYTVRSGLRPRWQNDADFKAHAAFLPGMETDLDLERPGQRIIVEAKFYAEPLRVRFDRAALRSEHLYQLMAYLHASRTAHGPQPEGVLLYAGVGEPLDLRFRIDGHLVRVRSLNLDQPWQGVRGDLLGMFEVPA